MVMVTGAPGSGKSTLGRQLATRLRVSYLSRDDIRWGMWATSRVWSGKTADHPRREAAREAFLEIVQLAAERGISAVLEFIIFQDHPENFRRLQTHADCLVIVTTCADPEGRAAARERSDPLLANENVLAAFGHTSIESYVQAGSHERERVRSRMVTDFDAFGVPTLAVRTDDGYEPSFEEIVDWVISRSVSSSSPDRE
jgi:cytidylate kinase